MVVMRERGMICHLPSTHIAALHCMAHCKAFVDRHNLRAAVANVDRQTCTAKGGGQRLIKRTGW